LSGRNGQRKTISVYSRPGCHLCEILLDELLPMIRGKLELEVRNIDTVTTWADRYGLRIPVVVFDGQEICHFKLDKNAVARIVDAESPAITAS